MGQQNTLARWISKKYWLMNQQTFWQYGLEAGRVGQKKSLTQRISKKALANEPANALAERIGSRQSGPAKYIDGGFAKSISRVNYSKRFGRW